MSMVGIDYADIAAKVSEGLVQAYTHRGKDINKSLNSTEQILAECQTTGYARGVALAKNQLGLFFLIRGDFEKAEAYSREALEYFETTNDTKGIADAHYNIGSIYYRTNNYHQGLIELLKCLQGYKVLSDLHNQSRTLKSMGTIYEYFNDFDKASDSYLKAIHAAREVRDESLESNALNPLSGIYYKQGNSKLAIETIERSIALKNKTGDKRGLAFALYGRAKIYIKENKPLVAINDLEEAIAILNEAEDMLGIGMAYNKMGLAYLKIGNRAEANYFFLQALELGEKYNVQFIRFKANFNLYLLAKEEGDQSRALENLEKYFLTKEQVINADTYNIIKSYEAVAKIEALEREAIAQKEKNEIIERKNAELDSFFYRVSHDLKGPISSLLGLHTVVKMDITDPASLQMFNMYHSQLLRMNDIVMGLINLTEIKNTEKLKTKIDFKKLVEECVHSCQYLPQAATIKVITDLQDFEFHSEWAIINTILQNLIENAIKYSNAQPNAFVKVSVRQHQGEVVMVVEDNGQGIPEAHQANIFNMFYRATDRAQGSGLGLCILKRAVERLNGVIEFSSSLNNGSLFSVRIPV
ncbi:MAG: tetratricopeptide repeat protein [Bacteroidota bacterium]|jgi:signal transduction histidine kinase|nr:tetratricopeptide repeat protein [Cytophagales bacterium]